MTSEQQQSQARPGDGEHTNAPTSPGRVTLRAVAIGLILVPFNVYWVLAAELRWYVILTLNPLFVTPIFYLFLLVGVNAFLRKRAKRHVFTSAELLIIYLILVVSCTVATHDFEINLMTAVAWPRWFATPSNGWDNSLLPHLPHWLFVWDKALLAGAFTGKAQLYRPAVLAMWFAPMAFWTLFIMVIGWSFLCINVLVRRAWVDHIRLSFPITRLPVMLIEEQGEGLKSRTLIAGALVAASLDILNGLHVWYPSLPAIPIRATPLEFPGQPWSGLTQPFFITFYPFAIGLSFLVPLDISFSCWFFYLFMKLQIVAGFYLGYSNTPDFPYISEQGIGAWYAFGFALLFSMRKYLKEVLRVALHPDGSDKDEPMSYRRALIGLVVGAVLFVIFWWQAGMSPWLGLLVMFTYFMLAVCITRVRAEAGGQHTVWDLEPMRMFRLVDSRLLGPGNLTAAAISHWYWRLNRSHIMPGQLEAFKMAKDQGIRLRSLIAPLMVALLLATVVGMWACLHIFYSDGATSKCLGFPTWTGVEMYDGLNNSLTAGYKATAARWSAVGLSALMVVVLAWLRARFVWFPFHPLGYCIGPGLMWLWLPCLIAWVLKLVILRYGGLKLYRRTLPFFLGLILGDYIAGALWSLIGVVVHVPVYELFH